MHRIATTKQFLRILLISLLAALVAPAAEDGESAPLVSKEFDAGAEDAGREGGAMGPWRCLLLAVLFALVPAAAAPVSGVGDAAPFIVAEARGKSMEQAVADLRRAISGHNYTFIRMQAVDMGLVPAAAENRNVVIVYFCNFEMLQAALRVNKRVGVHLPFRVTLIRAGDSVRLVALNPKFLAKSLAMTDLEGLWEQLATDYEAILSEAAL